MPDRYLVRLWSEHVGASFGWCDFGQGWGCLLGRAPRCGVFFAFLLRGDASGAADGPHIILVVAAVGHLCGVCG